MFCVNLCFSPLSKDEWLCAALDCMDFLPDQPVLELSKGLSHFFPQDLDNYEQEPNGGTSQDGGMCQTREGLTPKSTYSNRNILTLCSYLR